MLSRKAHGSLIGRKPHGQKIKAKFKTKFRRINLNVIICYVAQNETDDTNREQFYNRLQTIVDTKQISIVM